MQDTSEFPQLRTRVQRSLVLLPLIAVAMLLNLSQALAVVVTWTDWTSAATGAPGTASGTAGSIGVSYAGQVTGNTVTNNSYPSWGPASTFSGGNVSNAPTFHDIIGLTGGNTLLDTVTFSQPVLNPILAIWSLGQGSVNARFDFTNATPTLESCGPSNEFGGQCITIAGNSVLGAEGNGTVEFLGTFSSLSWTNPVFENWYGFTVGVAGVATTDVPEPSSFALLGAGLFLLAMLGLCRARSVSTRAHRLQSASQI